MSAVMVAEGTNAFDTMVVEGRTVNVTDMVLSHAGLWRYASLSGILLDLPGLERLSLKLNFEIAVDQNGRTQDRTFEGVPNSQCRILRAGWPRPILAQKYQIRHTRSKPSKWVLYL